MMNDSRPTYATSGGGDGSDTQGSASVPVGLGLGLGLGLSPQQQSKPLPRIFDVEKKAKFGIADTGDFEENVYRETESYKLIGQLFGRTHSSHHDKKEFTSADVSIEGYLFKRGSWFKNWKRRYFILRNDIKTLSYYDSHENLKLLGTIQLSERSMVWNPHAKDADGFKSVIAVQSNGDENVERATLIRHDDPSMISTWYNEIMFECLVPKTNYNSVLSNDIIKSIFEDAPTVENLPNLLKKQSSTGNGDKKEGDEKATKEGSSSTATSARQIGGSTDGIITSATNGGSATNTPSKENTFMEKSASFNSDGTISTLTPVGKTSSSSPSPSSSRPVSQPIASATSLSDLLKPDTNSGKKTDSLRIGKDNDLNLHKEDIDTDSDDEEEKTQIDRNINHDLANQPITPNSIRMYVQSKMPPLKRKKRKEEKEKAEKPPSEPPIAKPLVDRYLTALKCLAGVQLSVRLFNICSTQDRIFASIFSVSEKSKGSSYSHLQQISQTDIKTVYDKPEYGANCVEEVLLQFMICQDPMPPDCKYVMIALYREDANSRGDATQQKSKQGSGVSSNSRAVSKHQPLAQAIIPLRKWNQHPIFNVHLKILVENPVDISSPILARPGAVLGVVKLSSFSLAEKREQLMNSWGRVNPYAEMLFSFVTNQGQTLSLEQITASPHSITVSDAFVQLLHQERIPEITHFMEELLYQEESFSRRLCGMMDADATLSDLYSNSNLSAEVAEYEQVLTSLHLIEESGTIYKEEMSTVYRHLESCKSEGFEGMIVPPENGGLRLRRSAWKKNLKWQYCTTNLNIHMMTSRHFTASEIFQYVINPRGGGPNNQNSISVATSSKNSTTEPSSDVAAVMFAVQDSLAPSSASSSSSSANPQVEVDHNMNYLPTITLGCPTAHNMKFQNGGLRRIFSGVSNENLLMWMQVVQYPFSVNIFEEMIKYCPSEFTALFGSDLDASLPLSNECKYEIFVRKIELAKRLDMCGSQILGFALTFVKTVLTLAVHTGGAFLESLQRCLKIGFLLPLESLLSTSGHELGMIEDLYGASIWLSLVSLRFVQRNNDSNSSGDSRSRSNSSSGASSGNDGGSLGSNSTDIGGSNWGETINPSDIPPNIKICKHYGVSEGITIRRDVFGRLIVDLEVTDAEAAVIKECQSFMSKFVIPSSSAIVKREISVKYDKTQEELQDFGIVLDKKDAKKGGSKCGAAVGGGAGDGKEKTAGPRKPRPSMYSESLVGDALSAESGGKRGSVSADNKKGSTTSRASSSSSSKTNVKISTDKSVEPASPSLQNAPSTEKVVKNAIKLSAREDEKLSHKIQIIRARELPQADLLGESDPFVVIKFNGVEIGQTNVVKSTLNPDWEDQTFNIVFHGSQVSALPLNSWLVVEVWDYDTVGDAEFLGGYELQYDELKAWFVESNSDIGNFVPRRLTLSELNDFGSNKSVDQHLVNRKSTIEVGLQAMPLTESEIELFYFHQSLRFNHNPVILHDSSEIIPTVIAVAELYSVAFTQGVNEMQSLANSIGSRDIYRQVEINNEAFDRISIYFQKYKSALTYQLTILTPPDQDSRKMEHIFKKTLSLVEKMMDDVKQAVQHSGENAVQKHVHVPLKFSALCRKMAATVGILCKSGKDRTGMGVTLEITRGLVEDIGLKNGVEVCKLLRSSGVRRMNVHANTGSDKFAFNTVQRMYLPECYQPPPGTHAGNIAS